MPLVAPSLHSGSTVNISGPSGDKFRRTLAFDVYIYYSKPPAIVLILQNLFPFPLQILARSFFTTGFPTTTIPLVKNFLDSHTLELFPY